MADSWSNRIVGEGEEAPDQLLANPRNWRIHPKAQQSALAAVLDEVGWVQRVLVNRTTGHVVDGHLRVALAISRGEPTVPVTYLELSPEEEALVLASLDPLAGMAVTDAEILAELTAGMTVDNADLASLLGLDSPDGLLTDPDEVPPVPDEPKTKMGDLWLMGEHRLLCGDATDAAAVARLLNGTVPDIANCDPPYGLSVVKANGQIHGDTKGSIGGAKQYGAKGARSGKVVPQGVYAPIIGDETTDTAVAGYERAREVGVPVLVFWGGNYYADRLPASRCWLAWVKKTDESTFADAELAWTNQDHVVKVFDHHWAGMIRDSERGEGRVHPTQKPVALAEWVINTLAPNARVVLDLFLGSGWTLMAAERTDRICYGMEMSPAYCDVIVARWEAATGNEAKLDG